MNLETLISRRHYVPLMMILRSGPVAKSAVYSKLQTNSDNIREVVEILKMEGLLDERDGSVSRQVRSYRVRLLELTDKGMRIAQMLADLDRTLREMTA